MEWFKDYTARNIRRLDFDDSELNRILDEEEDLAEIKGHPNEDSTYFYCQPCRALIKSARGLLLHVNEEQHKKTAVCWRRCVDLMGEHITADGAMTDQILAQSKKQLIGLSHVVTVRDPIQRGLRHWVCLKCYQVGTEPDDLIEHLTTFKHFDRLAESDISQMYKPCRLSEVDSKSVAITDEQMENLKKSFSLNVIRGTVQCYHLSWLQNWECDSQQETDEKIWTKTFITDFFANSGTKFSVQFAKMDTKNHKNSALRKDFYALSIQQRQAWCKGIQYLIELWLPSHQLIALFYCCLCQHLTHDWRQHLTSKIHGRKYFALHGWTKNEMKSLPQNSVCIVKLEIESYNCFLPINADIIGSLGFEKLAPEILKLINEAEQKMKSAAAAEKQICTIDLEKGDVVAESVADDVSNKNLSANVSKNTKNVSTNVSSDKNVSAYVRNEGNLSKNDGGKLSANVSNTKNVSANVSNGRNSSANVNNNGKSSANVSNAVDIQFPLDTAPPVPPRPLIPTFVSQAAYATLMEEAKILQQILVKQRQIIHQSQKTIQKLSTTVDLSAAEKIWLFANLDRRDDEATAKHEGGRKSRGRAAPLDQQQLLLLNFDDPMFGVQQLPLHFAEHVRKVMKWFDSFVPQVMEPMGHSTLFGCCNNIILARLREWAERYPDETSAVEKAVKTLITLMSARIRQRYDLIDDEWLKKNAGTVDSMLHIVYKAHSKYLNNKNVSTVQQQKPKKQKQQEKQLAKVEASNFSFRLPVQEKSQQNQQQSESTTVQGTTSKSAERRLRRKAAKALEHRQQMSADVSNSKSVVEQSVKVEDQQQESATLSSGKRKKLMEALENYEKMKRQKRQHHEKSATVSNAENKSAELIGGSTVAEKVGDRRKNQVQLVDSTISNVQQQRESAECFAKCADVFAEPRKARKTTIPPSRQKNRFMHSKLYHEKMNLLKEQQQKKSANVSNIENKSAEVVGGYAFVEKVGDELKNQVQLVETISGACCNTAERADVFAKRGKVRKARIPPSRQKNRFIRSKLYHEKMNLLKEQQKMSATVSNAGNKSAAELVGGSAFAEKVGDEQKNQVQQPAGNISYARHNTAERADVFAERADVFAKCGKAQKARMPPSRQKTRFMRSKLYHEKINLLKQQQLQKMSATVSNIENKSMELEENSAFAAKVGDNWENQVQFADTAKMNMLKHQHQQQQKKSASVSNVENKSMELEESSASAAKVGDDRENQVQFADTEKMNLLKHQQQQQQKKSANVSNVENKSAECVEDSASAAKVGDKQENQVQFADTEKMNMLKQQQQQQKKSATVSSSSSNVEACTKLLTPRQQLSANFSSNEAECKVHVEQQNLMIQHVDTDSKKDEDHQPAEASAELSMPYQQLSADVSTVKDAEEILQLTQAEPEQQQEPVYHTNIDSEKVEDQCIKEASAELSVDCQQQSADISNCVDAEEEILRIDLVQHQHAVIDSEKSEDQPAELSAAVCQQQSANISNSNANLEDNCIAAKLSLEQQNLVQHAFTVKMSTNEDQSANVSSGQPAYEPIGPHIFEEKRKRRFLLAFAKHSIKRAAKWKKSKLLKDDEKEPPQTKDEKPIIDEAAIQRQRAYYEAAKEKMKQLEAGKKMSKSND